MQKSKNQSASCMLIHGEVQHFAGISVMKIRRIYGLNAHRAYKAYCVDFAPIVESKPGVMASFSLKTTNKSTVMSAIVCGGEGQSGHKWLYAIKAKFRHFTAYLNAFRLAEEMRQKGISIKIELDGVDISHAELTTEKSLPMGSFPDFEIVDLPF